MLKVFVILLLCIFFDMLYYILSSYYKKSVRLFEVMVGLIAFCCGILNGVESLLLALTKVGLKMVVFFLNLWSMASSSDDLEEVEARARFLRVFSSPQTCFTGVCWHCNMGLLTEHSGKLYSDLLLLFLIDFNIGAIGFGVLNALSW